MDSLSILKTEMQLQNALYGLREGVLSWEQFLCITRSLKLTDEEAQGLRDCLTDEPTLGSTPEAILCAFLLREGR